jgi:hypothetical protein
VRDVTVFYTDVVAEFRWLVVYLPVLTEPLTPACARRYTTGKLNNLEILPSAELPAFLTKSTIVPFLASPDQSAIPSAVASRPGFAWNRRLGRVYWQQFLTEHYPGSRRVAPPGPIAQ